MAMSRVARHPTCHQNNHNHQFEHPHTRRPCKSSGHKSPSKSGLHTTCTECPRSPAFPGPDCVHRIKQPSCWAKRLLHGMENEYFLLHRQLGCQGSGYWGSRWDLVRADVEPNPLGRVGWPASGDLGSLGWSVPVASCQLPVCRSRTSPWPALTVHSRLKDIPAEGLIPRRAVTLHRIRGRVRLWPEWPQPCFSAWSPTVAKLLPRRL